MIDYSGAVGSIFYSIYDGITNPIVPLNFAAGCTPQNAVTGATGANPGARSKGVLLHIARCSTVGDLNGAIPVRIRRRYV